MKTLVIVLLMAATATAQELTIPLDGLESRVSDIAALSVRNSDDLKSLRDRVAGIERSLPSLTSRIEQLEARAFEVPMATVVETITPPLLYTPVISVPQVVQRVAPVVKQPGGITFRTPVRRFLARFFLRRKLSNVTVGARSSSNHWTFPGDLSAHLIGPPHYLDPSFVYSLSNADKLAVHDSMHEGY